MENSKNVILTDSDRQRIDKLILSQSKYLSNHFPEKLLSINDLNNAELIDVLAKIDVYISEIGQRRIEKFETTKNMELLDESWIIEYQGLKNSIKAKLGINS